MAESMLTTVDNPFDPFTQQEEWDAYDRSLGYNTNALLARVAWSSHNLSEADQSLAIEQAIEEIVRENVTGVYRKVVSSNSADDKEETIESDA